MISITLQSWKSARSSLGSEMLGVGMGGCLFIYRFLPLCKFKNKSIETNSRSRSRPAQAPSTSEEPQQQEQAADLDAKQPDGAGILLPTFFRPGCKGHRICCLFVCPPLFPNPLG